LDRISRENFKRGEVRKKDNKKGQCEGATGGGGEGNEEGK
jgi:hypothetical protein